MKRIIALIATTAIMLAMTVVPALAQPEQNGLVNIAIIDVLNNNEVNVQVPIGVAANVCGVQANVLAQQNTQSAPVDCTAHTTQELPVAFRP